MPNERSAATPPPIPDHLKRIKRGEVSGSYPKAERRPAVPPPIPKEALIKQPKEKLPSPTELQQPDLIESREVKGFAGLRVCGTLEKKDVRKKGSEEPSANQDVLVLDPETGLVGVCDGLGGEGSGDKASAEAAQAFGPEFTAAQKRLKEVDISELQKLIVDQQMRRPSNAQKLQEVTTHTENLLLADTTLGRKVAALLESFKTINDRVSGTDGKTTATVGFVHILPSGERWAVVASVGDSTAYKRRKNGEMLTMNEEDSLLNTLIGSGRLTQNRLDELKQDANETIAIGGKTMNYKGLKQRMVAALGSPAFEPSLMVRRLEPGDALVFATDGVIDKFEGADDETDLEALAETYNGGKTPTERLDALRKEAKKRKTYKSDDDIGLVSVEVL